jgi:endo-1,4-beta-xylanase
MRRKISLLLAVAFMLSATFISAASSQHLPIMRNTRTMYQGFDMEFWTQNSNEGGLMTLTGGGTFTADWEDVFNILFRMGKKFDTNNNPVTYKDFGEITFEYAAIHEIHKGNVSYLCVYGWTRDPLIEFYVVDNYGSYNPGSAGTLIDTREIDGGIYNIYEATRNEQPSIDGTRTFQQYFSVRVDKRTEGTISLHEHFKAWEELGMDMSGNMYEFALCVEGFRTSGYADVYKNILTFGDTVLGADATREPLERVVAPEVCNDCEKDPCECEDDPGENGENNGNGENNVNGENGENNENSEEPPATSGGCFGGNGGASFLYMALGGALLAFLGIKKRFLI